MFSIKIRPCGQIYTMIAAESKMLQRWHRPGICVETRLQISHSQLPISQRSVPDSYESAIRKGPFIATQLNSTQLDVELSCVAINGDLFTGNVCHASLASLYTVQTLVSGVHS